MVFGLSMPKESLNEEEMTSCFDVKDKIKFVLLILLLNL